VVVYTFNTYIRLLFSKETKNVFKKTNGVGLKIRETVLVHKSYTDDGKLRMIIVNDQWTAILANFVRK